MNGVKTASMNVYYFQVFMAETAKANEHSWDGVVQEKLNPMHQIIIHLSDWKVVCCCVKIIL
jgi:hypothetical protein